VHPVLCEQIEENIELMMNMIRRLDQPTGNPTMHELMPVLEVNAQNVIH
jgi:hypothetical protein